MSQAPTSPYKGLNAFDDSELDALFFFGREREREIVVANLIASRLTVLYGPSGVGKSSLLRAAVARSLRELPEEPLVVVFSRWNENPAAALAEAVSEAEGGGDSNGSAVAALERAQSERDVYLILDQIEEYFLYHADDAGAGSFAEALPALLSAPHRVNVLVALREDSLAKLDRFTGRIPGLFGNTLRLDRLDREAARAAIVRPVERFAELTREQVAVDPGLVERVLDDVGAGQIEPALGGLGAVEGSRDGARIEAPYLQLVMQRLWEEERASGSGVLRVDTLDRLGGAQHIVEEHLEGAMSELSTAEKDIAARLFNHFVTPSGTKIAHEVSDLVDFGGVPVEELRPMLAKLSDRRILRSLEEGGDLRYEIFHDVLAQPVLAWRARHRTEREVERKLAESHRRRRRLQLFSAVVLVALGLMAAVTVFALDQRSEARDQAREAKAREFEAKARELEAFARGEFDSDPELGLLLAREAALLSPGASSEEALRDALTASRVRRVVDLGEPLVGAFAQGARVVAATADGSVHTVRTGVDTPRRALSTGAEADAASFSDDGVALLTGRDGVVRLVRPGGAVVELPGAAGARGAAVSGDGRMVVLFDDRGARTVEPASGEQVRFFDRPGTTAAALSRDGRLLATGHAGKTVRVWHTPTGARLLKLFGHVGGIVDVAFSPNGELVASASTDGTARVWEVESGLPVAVIGGHTNALTDVAFSADGTQLVTASRDRTVRVWKVDTSAPLAVLRGHADQVTSASFVGSGRLVVSAAADGTVRVWDARVQPELALLADLESPVTSVAFGRRGGLVRAETRDGKTHSLHSATGAELRAKPDEPLSCPRRGPDGTTAKIRGSNVVLRAAGGTTTLEGHDGRVTSACFSSDGTQLVTASRDRDARIWDVATGESRMVLQGHFGPVRDARFSPDGRWVVTAGPGRAGLWDVRSGSVTLLRGHRGPLTSAAFSPNGRAIVTGGVDGTVRTYRCDICGGLGELVRLADRRLAATGRELTPEERARYLG
jgi:WD40 repeat protein